MSGQARLELLRLSKLKESLPSGARQSARTGTMQMAVAETQEASEMPCVSSSVSSFISRGHCSARKEEDRVRRRRLEI